jgi:phosphoribosylglycinamide formyltransferase 1
MKEPLKYGIYCSGSATRVYNFYKNESNRINYTPQFIYYDGGNSSVIAEFQSWSNVKIYVSKNINNKESRESRRKIKSENLNEIMKNTKSKILLCFGTEILVEPLITEFQNKIINFHPSLLPAFKGLKSIDQALDYGAKFIGNTAHVLTKEVDSGKILAQNLMLKDDFQEYDDVLELQYPLLRIILRDIIGYTMQDEEISSEIVGRKKTWIMNKNI